MKLQAFTYDAQQEFSSYSKPFQQDDECSFLMIIVSMLKNP